MFDTSSSVLFTSQCVYGHPNKEAREDSLQRQIGEGSHHQVIQDDRLRFSSHFEFRSLFYRTTWRAGRSSISFIDVNGSVVHHKNLRCHGAGLTSFWANPVETITSLIAYSEHVVEEHVDDIFSLRCESPLLSSLAQLLTFPKSQRTPRSTILVSDLPTIEEEAEGPVVDVEEMHMEPRLRTTYSSCSCGLLTTSDSEAKCDAMLAAEFATFSFDSNDIQEWSDEVEREKQAKMDAHFAYVSEVLAVPVPKLSACFAIVRKDEIISDPSPVIFRGLRRVGNHEGSLLGQASILWVSAAIM